MIDVAHPLTPRAVALHQEGRLGEAIELYRNILAEAPRDFDATHLLGVAVMQQGRFDIAQRLLADALALNPNNASVLGNLGTSFMRDGQLETALQWFEIAVKLAPDSSVALTNVGTALHHVGRHLEAVPVLRRAFGLDPNSYEICNLLGACLIKTGEAQEAADAFEAATRADPANADGWANLSVALNDLKDFDAARECAEKALSLKPESQKALGALGAAHFDQGRLVDAIESYRKGVALPGPSAEMLVAFGNALLASGLNDEAIVQLERALELDPNNLIVRWAIAMARLKSIYQSESEILESRRQFAQGMDQVRAWYASHSEIVQEPYLAVGVSQPFFIAYQPFNNRELLMKYGALCAEWMTRLPRAPTLGRPPAGGKVRIGIASAFVSDHSVWNAITKGWIHHLDRTRFEIILFQLSRTCDRETEDARGVVDRIESQPASLPAWAQAIGDANLDVLIYPDIGMDQSTIRLAALRLAPVQAASWGHPETTGLPTMDLYISGDAFEPADAADNYSERLVRLPNFGVYVEPLAPTIEKLDLASLKLPRNQPLLLCPGAPFKYSPIHDEVWAEIAKRLKRRFMRRDSGGRLVFFRSRSETMDRILELRLRAAFGRAQVDFDAHVSIIPALIRPQFFALMQRSALMLDTLGFSGFNTAIQGIECGLPVLAFEGDFLRGRLASGIMRRLDLPELVATTTAQFVDKAVELAGDGARRRELGALIAARRPALFRDLTPVRALEDHLIDAVSHRSSARTGSRS